MAIPDWLKTVTRDELQVVNIKNQERGFLIRRCGILSLLLKIQCSMKEPLR